MGAFVCGRQLKAARALAGIRQTELADAAGLHVNSVRYLERKGRFAEGPCFSAGLVEKALADKGIRFTSDPGPGVVMVAM